MERIKVMNVGWFCDYTAKDKKSLIKHRSTHSKMPCPKCNQKFKSEQALAMQSMTRQGETWKDCCQSLSELLRG